MEKKLIILVIVILAASAFAWRFTAKTEDITPPPAQSNNQLQVLDYSIKYN